MLFCFIQIDQPTLTMPIDYYTTNIVNRSNKYLDAYHNYATDLVKVFDNKDRPNPTLRADMKDVVMLEAEIAKVITISKQVFCFARKPIISCGYLKII